MRAKVDKLVEQEMKKRPVNTKRDQTLNFPANFEFFKVGIMFKITFDYIN